MPKTITLDHVRVVGLAIQPAGDPGGYAVSAEYRLEEADDTPHVTRTITRYNAASGLQPTMPAAWETEFDGLLDRIATKLTALEGL